jgi:biotin carboxyl carrier protein
MSIPPVSSPSSPANAAASPYRLTGRNRLLFFCTAWLIVLMPFLFWWNTWFGRPLSAAQIGEYLQDQKHPRHIQHALVQLGDRMAGHDAAAKRWYPDIARLAAHPVEEVRNTDAWVMGQDTSSQAFHDALLKMLQDPSITVRGNAALSLVRFGDASGRPQIAALLQPASIAAPAAGRVLDIDKVGTSVHQGGLVAKLADGQLTMEVRSPINGRVRQIFAAPGVTVSQGAELVTVDPAEGQIWEALRALYLIGQPDDLPAIRSYERELPDISNRVRQQATLTENAILERARK